MGSIPEKALKVCRQHPQGASQQDLEAGLGISAAQCLELVNTLLTSNLVEAHLRGSDQTLLFKEKDQLKASKLKGLTTEDHLVLQAIENSKDQGIWTKDMKRETGLQQPVIAKSLKTLEARSLVKWTHSVVDGNKKIYLLHHIEPAKELTGGLWFAGKDMDMEFITVMQQHCKKIISRMGSATIPQVLAALQSAEVANVPLDVNAIETLMLALRALGEIEPVPSDPEAWRLSRQLVPERTAFSARPCGICPVREQCCPGGKVSPQTCVYLDAFLTW